VNATNLLVTGGAGFLGSNFVSRTLATRPNLKITVLDKLTYAGKRDNLPSESEQFRFVLGDILDQEVVNEETARADIVIHFAAETHNDNSLTAPRVFFETNVMGTEAVARAASLQGKRFHHISTDEVFGDLPLKTDETFSEDSQYKPSSPYSASKAASDHLVRSFVRSFGLRATITNCSNNFGLNQNWEKFIPHSVQEAVNGRPIRIYGTGRNVRDWIHVDDHTDGVWSVLDQGTLGETYLLGGNNQIDNLSLAKMILDALGLPNDYIEFVDDRPGHDLRYAMNYSKASNMLGWHPKKTSNFKHELELVVLNYQNKILNGDSVV
jgi:dTDP-glucose 4,6-dehydratase